MGPAMQSIAAASRPNCSPSGFCYKLPMTKLEKIEQQIATLDPADIRKLSDWLAEYQADLWDRQIEADAKAGKLDKLVNRPLPTTKPV